MRKRFIRTFAMTFLLTCALFNLSASGNVSSYDNMSMTVIVVKIPANNDSETLNPEERESPNQRNPGKRITCTIDTTTGIQFIGQETPDFTYFEIYDSNDICIGAFGDESDFLHALVSLSGEYQIFLNDAGTSYGGYVYL